MGWLHLVDDEFALLRYTCDLFFTTESPVHYIDQSGREPADFGEAYRNLLQKKVVDPKTFRLTDMALNRLAPLTECDARIIVTKERPNNTPEVEDFYVLDEIAVAYKDTDTGHMVGSDRDHDEIVRDFRKHFSPRRSKGDFVQVELTTGEYLIFALLAQDVRKAEEEDRMSLADILDALTDLGFSTTSTKDGLPPEQAPLRPYATRSVVKSDPADVFSSPSEEHTAVARPPSYKSSLPSDPTWESHIAALESKGAVKRDKLGHPSLHPTFGDLARGLTEQGRTSFIRYDFVDEEWLIRETTFLPVEGGLFFLGPTPEGTIAIRELDADRLDAALRAAVGPLPPAKDEQPSGGKKARDFLLKA